MGANINTVLSARVLSECLESTQVIYKNISDKEILFSYKTRDDHKTLLCIKYKQCFSSDDLSLIELFVQSVAIAQERMRFWQETEETLNEMIKLLSGSIEKHAKQGDQYFTGVTKIAMLLAKKHGLILKREISERQKKDSI